MVLESFVGISLIILFQHCRVTERDLEAVALPAALPVSLWAVTASWEGRGARGAGSGARGAGRGALGQQQPFPALGDGLAFPLHWGAEKRFILTRLGKGVTV